MITVRPSITVSLLPNGIHLLHYAGLSEPYTLSELIDEYPTDEYNWVYLNNKIQTEYLNSACEYIEH